MGDAEETELTPEEEARLAGLPRGAATLAGLMVGLLIVAWFLIYLLIYLPRGSIG
jgi:hypothetical protein